MMELLDRPEQPHGLHVGIARTIATHILSGAYAVGSALPSETALGLEFGVSRTALREAVKVLASKGLIESRPKVGIRVRSRQHWSILDPDLLEWRLRLKPDRVFVLEMTEMRRIFEPAAAALAATRATPEQIAFAKRHLGQMRDGVHDSEVYVSADIAFHGTILAMTQNELLAGFGRTMEAALTLSRRLTVLLPDSALKSLPAHAAVLEAICRRDSATAESKMRELVDGTRADLDAVFSEMRLRQRQAADP